MLPLVPSPLEILEGAILDLLSEELRSVGEGRSQNCDLGSPCHYMGDPSTRVVSAMGSSIPAKRRRARFRHSDGEGATASWESGQNREGR
jgi:hypothetical protein